MKHAFPEGALDVLQHRVISRDKRFQGLYRQDSLKQIYPIALLTAGCWLIIWPCAEIVSIASELCAARRKAQESLRRPALSHFHIPLKCGTSKGIGGRLVPGEPEYYGSGPHL